MAYLLLLQYTWSVKPWTNKYVKGDTNTLKEIQSGRISS